MDVGRKRERSRSLLSSFLHDQIRLWAPCRRLTVRNCAVVRCASSRAAPFPIGIGPKLTWPKVGASAVVPSGRASLRLAQSRGDRGDPRSRARGDGRRGFLVGRVVLMRVRRESIPVQQKAFRQRPPGPRRGLCVPQHSVQSASPDHRASTFACVTCRDCISRETPRLFLEGVNCVVLGCAIGASVRRRIGE